LASDQELDTTAPVLPDGDATEPARPVVRLSIAETARVLGGVVAPTLAIGVIKRRPAVMRWVERLRLDRVAIRTMRRLRDRHGPDAVALRIPGRSIQLPLAEVDAGLVLAGTPDPFTPATVEKKAALRHFQPHAVLISGNAERPARRALNEAALQPDEPMHTLAPAVTAIARDEAARLVSQQGTVELGWDEFNRAWWAVVRRIVLGDHAREDAQLTDLLGTLRQAGNWAYLRPRRRRQRQRFLAEIAAHVRQAEPGSLAAELAAAARNAPGDVDPAGQAPHWLFAFDAAGMATARTLALLARHPEQARAAHEEAVGTDDAAPRLLPYLRACVLESVRLWPTTPALLRETVRDTRWGPRGTSMLLYTPYFHRDSETLPFADTFAPHIWLDGTAASHPGLVPFSAGAAECPGRNVVLLATSTLLAALVAEHDVELVGKPDIDHERPLPATLDNFSIRLRFRARDTGRTSQPST
jgi:cytochrome P450